jgi:hypothetical protein
MYELGSPFDRKEQVPLEIADITDAASADDVHIRGGIVGSRG